MGAFHIQIAVVDKHAFVRGALRHLKCQAIDSFVGFADADKTGTKKSFEFPAQVELLNPPQIQLPPLVVDHSEKVFPGLRQSSEYAARNQCSSCDCSNMNAVNSSRVNVRLR